MRRSVAAALFVLVLDSSAHVAGAQSADTTTCRASVDRKAVVGRVIDAETGKPPAHVFAYLEAHRPDTTFSSDSEVIRGISVSPVFRRRAELDASGQFCFTDLRAGEYRFEARAMRMDASHQAIVVHLGSTDTLKKIALRYRPFGRSPEEELVVARMLEALDANRRRWVQSRPPHYLLRVRRDCGCLEGPPMTYEVLHGVAVAIVDSSGVRSAKRGGAGARTVDSMFNALRASLLDERQWVGAVEYDQRFGWPRHYKTGMRTLMTDAWEEFTVERFDVIK